MRVNYFLLFFICNAMHTIHAMDKTNQEKKLKSPLEVDSLITTPIFDALQETNQSKTQPLSITTSMATNKEIFATSEQTTSTSALQNAKKRKPQELNLPTIKKQRQTIKFPSEVYFSIICRHCSDFNEFRNYGENSIKSKFKRHMQKEHPEISPEKRKQYIDNDLQRPPFIVRHSIKCPLCPSKFHANEKSLLKIYFFKHIFDTQTHELDKHKYTKESLKEYLDQKVIIKFISEQQDD